MMSREDELVELITEYLDTEGTKSQLLDILIKAIRYSDGVKDDDHEVVQPRHDICKLTIETAIKQEEDLDLLCNSLNAQAGRFKYSDPVLRCYLLRAQAAINSLCEMLKSERNNCVQNIRKIGEVGWTDREKITKAVEYLNWYFTEDDGMADKTAVKAWEVLFREQKLVR